MLFLIFVKVYTSVKTNFPQKAAHVKGNGCDFAPIKNQGRRHEAFDLKMNTCSLCSGSESRL